MFHRRDSTDRGTYNDAPSVRDRDYDQYSSTSTSSYQDPYYEENRRGGMSGRRDSRTMGGEQHHGAWTASGTATSADLNNANMTGRSSEEPGMLRRGIEAAKDAVGAGDRDRTDRDRNDRSAYRSYSRDSWERDQARKNRDPKRRDVDFDRDNSRRSDFYNDQSSYGRDSQYGSSYGPGASHPAYGSYGSSSHGAYGSSSYGYPQHYGYGHGYDSSRSMESGIHDYGYGQSFGGYGQHYGGYPHSAYYGSTGSHSGYGYPHYYAQHYNLGQVGHAGTGYGYAGVGHPGNDLYAQEWHETRRSTGRGIGSLTKGMKGMNVDGRIRPEVDIYGSDSEWIIEMDLPGFVRENIDMKFIGDNLEITATPVNRDQSIKYHVFERTNPTYFRKIHLPPGIDGKRINAVLTNGVLRITVPKVDIGNTGTTGSGITGSTGSSSIGSGISTGLTGSNTTATESI